MAAGAVQAAEARLRARGARLAQAIATLPKRLPRATPLARNALPGVVATLTAELDCALVDAGVTGQVIAAESTARAVAFTLQVPDLSAAQTHHIRAALQGVVPAVRWRGMHRLSIPLPLAQTPRNDCAPPCVPILRRRASTLWWPLTELRPLILAGDALPTLHVVLETLAESPQLVLYDPEQTLHAQDMAVDHWPAHTSDALAIARAHALRTAYRRTHGPDMPLPAPLTLVVVAPDAAAWHDLTPLLTQLDDGGVRLILAFTAGASHPAAQDACRRGHGVEIGALGRPVLPEACRPPGLAAPRPGTALAWQTPQRHWRGAPLDRTAP